MMNVLATPARRLARVRELGSLLELTVEAERLEDGTYVVAVAGEVDLWTASRLKHVLDGVLSDAATSVIVDLTQCSFIDTTGLRLLVEAHKRLTDLGRPFSLVSPNRRVLDVLDVTELSGVLTTHPTRAEALRNGRS